ncbi:MAG: hypothetical protein EKK41_15755 [Hyphomicrobiales bacterium]|nr:MAG: hypothetical protein EKK41_15755 [Hyphomicrobiales bacterium]
MDSPSKAMTVFRRLKGNEVLCRAIVDGKSKLLEFSCSELVACHPEAGELSDAELSVKVNRMMVDQLIAGSIDSAYLATLSGVDRARLAVACSAIAKLCGSTLEGA